MKLFFHPAITLIYMKRHKIGLLLIGIIVYFARIAHSHSAPLLIDHVKNDNFIRRYTRD